MAGYQSIFSSGSGSSAPSDGNYHSIFGFSTQRNPTSQELAQMRQQQVVANSPAVKAAPPKPTLFSRVGNVVKGIGKGMVQSEQTVANVGARLLPGGQNDIKAENQATDQANKDRQIIAQIKNPTVKANLLKANQQGLEQNAQNIKSTAASIPTRGQAVAGVLGTAADVLTAGAMPELKGAKAAETGVKSAEGATKTSKALTIARKQVPLITGNAAAGGLNAAAGGGDKKQIAENAVLGAALPTALSVGAHAGGKVVNKAVDKVNTAPAKELIQNQKTQTLLHYEPSNPKVQALVAAGEKQRQAIEAPAKAAEAEQTKAAKTAEVTQAQGQKIDRQVQLLKAKKADNGGSLSNVDQVKLQHLQEDKQKLGTTQAPTVEKVPGATPTEPVSTTPPKSAAVSATKPEAATPKLAEPKAGLEPTLSGKQVESGASKLNNKQEGLIPAKETAPAAKTYQTIHAGGEIKQVTGEPVDLVKGVDTFVHPGKGGYVVSEASTGRFLAESQSKDGAIAKAKSNINDVGEDNFRQLIKDNQLPESAKVEASPIKQTNEAAPTEKPSAAQSAAVSEPSTTKVVVNPNAPPETGASKIAQDVQAKAVAKNLTDKYGELAQYNKINVANEADKAVKFVNGDKNTLMQVVRGEKPLPSDLRATAVIKAIEEHPQYSKDGEVLKELARSPLNTESSRSAQELRLAAERDQYSATTKMNELSKAREQAFKAKTGQTEAKATSAEVKAIRAAVPKAKVTKETWGSFIDSLKC